MKMSVKRITSDNIDSWIGDISDLGNGFLESIGQDPKKNAAEDHSVIRAMVEAEQTEIFLAATESGRAVGISYLNVGTGFSCRGKYLWINGVFVHPEFRKKGFGSALLAEIEKFGKEIGARLITSYRDISNQQSRKLFAKCRYHQEKKIVISKNQGS